MNLAKSWPVLVILVVSATLAFGGCTSPTTPPVPTAASTSTPAPTAVTGTTVLTIVGGRVNDPLILTTSDLYSPNKYDQHYVEWKDGNSRASYKGTGPFVSSLLYTVGIGATHSDANVTFTCLADDSNTTIEAYELVIRCSGYYTDAIITSNWTGTDEKGNAIANTDGTLRLIVPNGTSTQQVSNVTLMTISR